MTTPATLADEFIPGSVTDTCGICFKRFDLQYPADQYSTVRNWGTDTFDLVCPDCEDEIAADDATMTEYPALDEHLIPTGAHWTPEGPHGENWVMRWNRVTGTVQARRWSHERGTGFSAEASDLPSARREARRIAKLISEGQTGDCRSCSRGEDGGGEPCDCPTACGARYCQHPTEKTDTSKET